MWQQTLIYFSILIQLVHSFSVPAPFTQNPNKALRFHTKFKNVNIKHGIYHIHSIEHISRTHVVGAPFFHIHDILPPESNVHTGVNSISFMCSVLFSGKMIVRMCTKYANRSEMQFRFADGSKFVTIRLTVLPCLEDVKSHNLFLEVFLFQTWVPVNLVKVFLSISLLVSSWEDTLSFAGKNVGIYLKRPKHIHYFSKYRKSLGLDFPDSLMHSIL